MSTDATSYFASCFNTAARISLPICPSRVGGASWLPDLVATRLETVDEELAALFGVELPAAQVVPDPSRDHAQIALGLSLRLAVALGNVEKHAHGLLRGRCAGQPHGL